VWKIRWNRGGVNIRAAVNGVNGQRNFRYYRSATLIGFTENSR